MAKTRRTRWTPAKAGKMLDELDASGLTAAEFARQRGLHPQRLGSWRKRFDLEDAVSGPAIPRLVELVPTLSVPAAPVTMGRMSLRYPGGPTLDLAPDDFEQGLRAVLSVLQEVGQC